MRPLVARFWQDQTMAPEVTIFMRLSTDVLRTDRMEDLQAKIQDKEALTMSCATDSIDSFEIRSSYESAVNSFHSLDSA